MVGLYYNVQQSSAMLCWLSLQCRVHRLVPGYRTSNLLGHCSYQPNEISKKDIKILRFNICSPQKRKFRFMPNFFYISCCWVLTRKKMTCYSLWPAAVEEVIGAWTNPGCCLLRSTSPAAVVPWPQVRLQLILVSDILG